MFSFLPKTAENIKMPPMHIRIHPPSIMNISFIIFWNINDELHRPKNITKGLNSPLFVLNTPFHSSASIIHTLLYLHLRSSFVKHLGSFSLSRRQTPTQSMLGNKVMCSLMVETYFLTIPYDNCQNL